jgi:adenylosuccinate synthase
VLSETAHVVFPYHRELDAQREVLKGKNKIGTTKRGIGPAYGDKAARVGLRVNDLVDPAGSKKNFPPHQGKQHRAQIARRETAVVQKGFCRYNLAAGNLKPFVQNTVVLLHDKMREGADILFEGAQGTFLDIDHGTYPFVTSSNTTAGGACTGSGVPPHRMDRVVGVMKAYTTRVGEGPLPTENQEISDLLHGMGREFGATTGRARRCGWFDSVATRHATMVNGIDDLAITNLDGLDTVERIKVCVAYRHGKSNTITCRTTRRCWPNASRFMWNLKAGARRRTSAKTFKQLPAKARAYREGDFAELSNARLFIASVGPGREQTIFVFATQNDYAFNFFLKDRLHRV